MAEWLVRETIRPSRGFTSDNKDSPESYYCKNKKIKSKSRYELDRLPVSIVDLVFPAEYKIYPLVHFSKIGLILSKKINH